MASASVAARGIRGAALINGKILDDAIIGIDPTGVGKIVSVARARNGTALAARARRVTGLIILATLTFTSMARAGTTSLGLAAHMSC